MEATKLTFGTVLLAAITGSARTSYPIPPVPLRELVSEAEIIVVAKVGDISKPAEGARDTDSRVHLQVEACLKGKTITEIIVAVHESICPEPAKYDSGTRVLAFLEQAKRPGEYKTCSLSYGAKTLDEASMDTYVARVNELLVIQETSDLSVRHRLEIAWIVSCATAPATRWEGAYELCKEDVYLGDEPTSVPTDLGRELNEDQRAQLRESLLRCVRIDNGERCLESLFATDRDPRLHRWLIAQLHRQIQKSPNNYPKNLDLLRRIQRRDGRAELQTLVNQYERHSTPGPRSELDDDRMKILTKILKLID